MHRVFSNVTLEGNDVIWINPQLSSTGENEFVVPLHVAIVNTNGKLPAIDPLRFIYLFIYKLIFYSSSPSSFFFFSLLCAVVVVQFSSSAYYAAEASSTATLTIVTVNTPHPDKPVRFRLVLQSIDDNGASDIGRVYSAVHNSIVYYNILTDMLLPLLKSTTTVFYDAEDIGAMLSNNVEINVTIDVSRYNFTSAGFAVRLELDDKSQAYSVDLKGRNLTYVYFNKSKWTCLV